MRDSACLLALVAMVGCSDRALPFVSPGGSGNGSGNGNNNNDGEVVVGVSVYSGRPFSSDDFASADFTVASTDCQALLRGTCRRDTCATRATAPSSAGTVAITGLLQPVQLTLTPQGYAAQWDVYQPLLGDGEQMVVTASGGDIPAFSASLVTPRALEIDTPYPPPADSKQRVPYDRSRDLTLSWRPDGGGDVDAWMSSTDGSGANVHCLFAGEGGSGVVPHQLLEQIPPGEALIDVHNGLATRASAGRWQIPVSASRMSLDANGQAMVQLFDLR